MSLLLLAIDSPHETEVIYAQVLREEQALACTVAKFNPMSNFRQKLVDYLAARPESYIALVGSAELQSLQFPVYCRKTGVWSIVPKEGLRALTQDDPTSLDM